MTFMDVLSFEATPAGCLKEVGIYAPCDGVLDDIRLCEETTAEELVISYPP